ncbi:MAG: hypothetical protein ACKOCK_07315, partial [Chloroflexota bacterium]
MLHRAGRGAKRAARGRDAWTILSACRRKQSRPRQNRGRSEIGLGVGWLLGLGLDDLDDIDDFIARIVGEFLGDGGHWVAVLIDADDRDEDARLQLADQVDGDVVIASLLQVITAR